MMIGQDHEQEVTMRLSPVLAALAAVALSACEREAEISPSAAFMEDCAGCHGPAGKGSRALGLALDPPAPDLTTLAARNGGVFPRDYVMSTIDGLSRGAHFSAAMPEFGEGDLGDTVIVENPDGTGTPVPARLLALADYVESLQD
jgi:mono/diheme cytochrome c family protein